MEVCTLSCVNYGISFLVVIAAFTFCVHSSFRVVRVLHFFSESFFSIKLAVEFTANIVP